MTTIAKIVATALAGAVIATLAGCSNHDHIDLSGVKIGMTRDQVVAVAPEGSTLYCRGDGDAQFEKAARLPESTSSTYCTWAAGAAGSRSVASVAIGKTASTEALLAFSSDGRLASFAVATPATAYSEVVASIKDKWGSPDSDQEIGGLTWTTKDGTLDVNQAGQGTNDEVTLLLLKPTRAPVGG